MWVYNDESKEAGQYRCPLCTHQYAPWKEKKSKTEAYITANKLMVIDAAGPIPEMLGGEAMNKTVASGGTSKGSAASSSHIFVPFLWPDTKTTTLINRMKEICEEITTDVADNNLGAQTLIDRVNNKVEQKIRSKVYWRQTTMPPKSLGTFQWLNEQSSTKWHFDHLLQPWPAAQYQLREGEPVLDEDDLIRMFLYTRLAVLGQSP